jgi:class 3 adenylate cyclase
MQEPHGGLTLVFTDIEGSTALLRELGGSYGLALRVHHSMLTRAFEEHRGRPMGTEGDAAFFAFSNAADAVTAAIAAQQRVEHHEWPEDVRLRVRIGIHNGPVTISGGEYVGLTVHEVARICAVAHGGQIVCSSTVLEALGDGHGVCAFRDLGIFGLRGFPAGTQLFQVCADGLDADFPPLRDTVRDGGRQVSVWFREPSRRRPAPKRDAASLTFRTVDGAPLGDDLEVDVRLTAQGPGSFGLVVRRDGCIEEEYDGLTIGGPTDAAAIVNAHSRLVRIGPWARSKPPG